MINIHAQFILILVTIFSLTAIAKDQNGDPFGIDYTSSTFLQGDTGKTLNGLQIMSRPLPGEPYFLFDIQIKSPMSEISDNYKLLLDVFPKYKVSNNNISDVDILISHTGESNAESWSNHTLSTKYGGLAFRYLDKVFQDNLDWNYLFHEYEKNPPEFLIDSGDIETLSPIEKYEYLIGNTNFTMTQDQWQEGQNYINQFGFIPTWVGFCHGTTPATLNSPRPVKAIKLKSYNEKHTITFYPSDIKELISYAWANTVSPSAIVGRRCGSVVYYGNRPSFDCLDPNPGSFHLAILNLLGLNGQSFIIDSSAGNEVWNRSIKSYRYQYFKPGTHNFTDKLKYALISRNDYKNDPYSIYRSSQTTSLVGVWMELTYIVDTKPSNSEVDSAKNDTFGTIAFWYDLEINQEGNIIGGEWQNEHHPDFLWVIGDNIFPKSFYDYVMENNLDSYDGKHSLPSSIVNYAKLAAKKDQLLFSILERMLKLSRRDN